MLYSPIELSAHDQLKADVYVLVLLAIQTKYFTFNARTRVLISSIMCFPFSIVARSKKCML